MWVDGGGLLHNERNVRLARDGIFSAILAAAATFAKEELVEKVAIFGESSLTAR